MQHDEFIGKVQQRARLSSRSQAETATEATLLTLAERLVGGSAENIAAQLDPETAQYMDDVEFGEPFSLEEFFERVSDREGVDVPDAVHHARSVVSVLCEAVSEGALRNARAQLSEEWDPLFEAGSEGEMRPSGERRGRSGRSRRPAAETEEGFGDEREV